MEKKAMLESPECIECFDEITDQANDVLTKFKTEAEKLLESFRESFHHSMKEMSDKHDRMLIAEGEKATIFYNEQDAKQDKTLGKLEKRFNQMMLFNFFLLGLFATAITYIFVVQQSKASAAEVLNTNTYKNILNITNSYLDQRYVLRPDQKFDQANYQMIIETLLERNARGIPTTIIPFKNSTK